jgi:hypothetical protein
MNRVAGTINPIAVSKRGWQIVHKNVPMIARSIALRVQLEFSDGRIGVNRRKHQGDPRAMSTEQREINALGERGGPQRQRPTARRAETGHDSSG